MKKYIVLLTAICSLQVWAQTPENQTPQQLDTILLKATRIASQKERLPAAVSVYESNEKIAVNQQLSLQEYMAQMSGVYAQNANNFAQDLRISIRGFGARAAFGIRGVKLIVDGIPETTPDGQGQLDNINLGIIQRIEVIKGPSSSLYGNASGGVIAIETTEDFEANFAKAKIGNGSYGFQNYQATTGFSHSSSNYVLHANYTTSDGYRDQSGFQQFGVNARGNHQINDKLKLSSLLNYSNSPQADDPGSLNLEALLENRRQARDRNMRFQTGEKVAQFKAGVSLDWKLKDTSQINSYVFYTNRSFEGKLPFEFGGIVNLNRDYIGQGSSFTYRQKSNTLKVGYDLGYQSDARIRYRNLEGTQGTVTLNQKEQFTNIGVFLVDHFQKGKWLLTGGLRYDYNKLEAKDQLLDNGDDSGSLQLNAFNPSIGVSYAYAKMHTAYANVATSFETPSLSELSADPSGGQGFNDALKPQKAINYEVGMKGKFNAKWHYQVAGFVIDTSDDLVPFELEDFPDRTFFRNAGKTNRKGVEVGMQYALTNAWSFSTSYTYSDFQYTEFRTPNGNFEGNALPGIPMHYTQLGIDYKTDTGWRGSLQARLVGEIQANDANDTVIDGYEYVTLNLGYLFDMGEWSMQPFLGLNNILDQEYTDNVRINAFGGRYYEAAPTFNMFGGVTVRL